MRASLLVLGCAALAGCLEGAYGTQPSSDAAAPDAPAVDASVTDVPRVDATPPPPDRPVVDSGCPAPTVVTPEMLPRTGFLAPVRGRFVRAVDGDTAHFVIPITGEVTVRFLWVNTEESHGMETTVFGVRTANEMMAAMPMVREYTIVQQEDSRRPGQPALDPYMRRLAVIFADGDLWEKKLVREGWSAYYTDFGCAPEPAHSALLFAEAEARANQRGIWAPGHPTNYAEVFSRWITTRCRPNPFRNQPYCTR